MEPIVITGRIHRDNKRGNISVYIGVEIAKVTKLKNKERVIVTYYPDEEKIVISRLPYP
jgi:hypothetical protein